MTELPEEKPSLLAPACEGTRHCPSAPQLPALPLRASEHGCQFPRSAPRALWLRVVVALEMRAALNVPILLPGIPHYYDHSDSAIQGRLPEPAFQALQCRFRFSAGINQWSPTDFGGAVLIYAC